MLATVQVVVEVSYVKNPQFFVVELAGTSKFAEDNERFSKLEAASALWVGNLIL